MDGEQNWRDGRDLTTIFDTIEFPDAYRVSYLANAIVIPAYDEVKRRFGIIRAEYLLLCCLSHYRVLNAQDVALIARQPRNTVSRAVHRMLSEGCIARAPDPGDGRQALLTITPKGRALHVEVAETLRARQEVVLDGLNATERETLSALLLKAAKHAAAHA